MTRDEIEDLYNGLCARLTEAGEENTPMVLARLVLLLVSNMTDAKLVESLIDEAVRDYVGAGEASEGAA